MEETPKRRVRVDVETRQPVARPQFSGGPLPDLPLRAEHRDDDPPAETQSSEDCACPRLDAEDWHEVESDWSDIAFVEMALTSAAGVPIGYQGAFTKLSERARSIGATVPDEPMLLLGEGRFRRPVLLEVDGAPEKAKGLVRPGGVAYTRLVPAPLGEIRQVVNETNRKAAERYGRQPDSTWLWYLTCRYCSADRDYETLVVAHYRAR
ncbi:MAG: hydrolase [Dehalococcoidia bacterium]